MMILASAVRPAKAIITWLSRTQIFCTVLSSCSLAWNMEKKISQNLNVHKKDAVIWQKKYSSKFLPQPFFPHQEQQHLFLVHQLLWIPFWRLLEHIQPRKKNHTFHFFALIVCFSIWTIDGAAIALWRNYIISACSLYII